MAPGPFRRPGKTIAFLILAAVVLFAFHRSTSSSRSASARRVALSTTVDRTTPGCLIFDAEDVNPARQPVMQTPEGLLRCSEAVETGLFAPACVAPAEKEELDALFTWVNGSDTWLFAVRSAAQRSAFGPPVRPNARMRNPGGRDLTGANQFWRDHGELKYAMRSVVRALPGFVRDVHLVVADVPLTGQEEERCAQVPQWLDHEQAGIAGAGSRAVTIHPHSLLFSVKGAETPSFNSISIESQIFNARGLGAHFIYLNDDTLFLADLRSADFYSPQSGPVIRVQRDLRVEGLTLSDPDERTKKVRAHTVEWRLGEWKGLELAGGLLDQRFGIRRRPYVAHVAKTASKVILSEIAEVFRAELEQTAKSRFRGQETMEAQVFFLATQYLVEKHRETLLWSFIVARSDTDRDGLLTRNERQGLLEALGYTRSHVGIDHVFEVARPRRTSLGDLLRSFRNDEAPLATTFVFSSMDGYAYFDNAPPPPLDAADQPRKQKQKRAAMLSPKRQVFQGDWPSFTGGGEIVCSIAGSCFGNAFWQQGELESAELFKEVAFRQPKCGDCLIVALVGQSGPKGLSAFLPEGGGSKERSMGQVQLLGGGNRWFKHADFSLVGQGLDSVDLRLFVKQLLARYTYTMAESPMVFERIRAYRTALSAAKKLSWHAADSTETVWAAFIALNDDMKGGQTRELLTKLHQKMTAWFEEKVGRTPAAWERAGEGADGLVGEGA